MTLPDPELGTLRTLGLIIRRIALGLEEKGHARAPAPCPENLTPGPSPQAVRKRRGVSSGLAITSTGRQHRRNASQRAVDVEQDLLVFQSHHALAVVQQELIALCIQVHPTAV